MSLRACRLVSVLALGAIGLSACGSSSLSGNSSPGASGASGANATSISADPALAAKVPAKVKSAGKIVFGSDTTYPPNEFLGADGRTAQGMDIDLASAVAAKLGLKAEFQTATFDSIILGVGSGKYDAGISSFTIRADRMKQATMVSYYKAGTLWAVAKGNPKGINVDDLCGKSVGVQKGTVQNDEMDAKNKACAAAGKPAVNVFVDDQQVKVTNALASGKVDAMGADSPVVIDAIGKSNGAFEKLGSIYDTAPYGIVLPKSETEFGQAMADALKQLEASGEYLRILTTWQGQDGAINDFTVNPKV